MLSTVGQNVDTSHVVGIVHQRRYLHQHEGIRATSSKAPAALRMLERRCLSEELSIVALPFWSMVRLVWQRAVFTERTGRENLAEPIPAETHELLAKPHDFSQVVPRFLVGESVCEGVRRVPRAGGR